MMNYGKREWLRDLRTDRNLTQTDVARMLNISMDHYQRIEYGQRNPSSILARKIAVLFDFPMERFYEAPAR